jgi:putative ABC transport system permease protein
MKDYHQTSLKENIEPLIFENPQGKDRYGFLMVSVTPTNFDQTVSAIETIWKKLVNNTPFEYTFLDENIRKQYDEDRKVSSIITSFTLIAMLISCLGLYGLSSYMAERRFKEIGVRKVMGASVNQIVGLMSFEFVKLVVIAFVIAVPISYYAMNQWLQGFAFHIPLDVTVFVLAGLAALLIALLTVSFESLRAATTNPIKSLRSE